MEGLGIIRFEIVCTSAWRTYRLHGVRIILRDRDPGVAQNLDWGRHTPRLACHHFNYIHPAQCPPPFAPRYPVALIKLLAGYFPCNAASLKRSASGIRVQPFSRFRDLLLRSVRRWFRRYQKINKSRLEKLFSICISSERFLRDLVIPMDPGWLEIEFNLAGICPLIFNVPLE